MGGWFIISTSIGHLLLLTLSYLYIGLTWYKRVARLSLGQIYFSGDYIYLSNIECF